MEWTQDCRVVNTIPTSPRLIFAFSRPILHCMGEMKDANAYGEGLKGGFLCEEKPPPWGYTGRGGERRSISLAAAARPLGPKLCHDGS